MGFLREAKGLTPALEGKSARTAFAVSSWQRGRPYQTGWSVERAVEDGLSKVHLLWRAIHAIADNEARLPMLLRKGHPLKGTPIEDHFALPLLNVRANPDERSYPFRYALSAQVLISKKGAMVEVIRNRLGDPIALYLHHPDKISPVPDPSGKRLVSGFVVDLGEGKTETLKSEDVIWFKRRHPTNPYLSWTPLESIGIDVDIAFLARLYNRTFLKNDGRPGGIVGVKGDLDDDVKEDLEDRWNQPITIGPGRISVVEADGLDFVDTAVTPRDAQYVESMKITKESILGGMGTPESVALAYAADRTYDNAEAEKFIFWESTMAGHCALLANCWNDLDPDDSVFTGYDFSGVDVLQRVEAKRRETMRAEVQAGVRTLNSYLEETGEERIASPEADAYWLPMSYVPIAYADGVVPTVNPGEATVTPLRERMQAAALAIALESKEGGPPFVWPPTGGVLEAEAVELAGPGGPDDPWLEERKVAASKLDKAETRTYKAARAMFEVQEAFALSKLRSAKVRKGTRHWDYGTTWDPAASKKAIDPDKVYPLDRFRKDVEKTLLPEVEATMVTFGEDSAALLGGSFNVKDPAVTEDLLARSNRLRGVADTTWDAVRGAIVAGEAAGESIDDIAKRVGGVFRQAKGYRARMIARTETIGAANAGSFQGAVQSGVVGEKVWLSAIDARTREHHVTADGQVRAMTKPFDVGGGKLMHPGDPMGGARNVINCRCSMLFRKAPQKIEDPEEGDLVQAVPTKPGKIAPKGEKPSVNLAKDVKTKGGKPVGPNTKVPKAIRAAQEAIDSVHGSPALVENPLPLIASTGERRLGGFAFGRASGTPAYIEVSSAGQAQAFNYAHEFGHFFDLADFGASGRFSSMTEEALGELMDAIKSSPNYARWTDMRANPGNYSTQVEVGGRMRTLRSDHAYVRYLQQDEELFARAYSQWIATETQDPDLMKGLDWWRRAKEGEGIDYQPQWSDEDFEPIAQAFRKLFSEQGLTE